MKGNQVRGESYSLQFRLFSCVQDCLDLARKVSLCDLGLNVRTIRIQEGRKRCILVAGETAWGKVESKVRHTVFTANSGVPDLEDFVGVLISRKTMVAVSLRAVKPGLDLPVCTCRGSSTQLRYACNCWGFWDRFPIFCTAKSQSIPVSFPVSPQM